MFQQELKVSRESIETVREQKDYATLGKLKSFQYVWYTRDGVQLLCGRGSQVDIF